MKTYTVAQLARLAGVSVRTLHHYDEIGLLKPARVGQNRYRRYAHEELLRLQQILINRELGIPLMQIAPLLEAPDYDRVATLVAQRERLEAEARRYSRMVATIDRTIAKLKGEGAMQDADLYTGIVSPEKQAEYQAWLKERHGEGILTWIDGSKRAYRDLPEAEKQRLMAELKTVEEALAEAMRIGTPPEARSLDAVIERHRDWVSVMWGKPCPPKAYAGLADTYLAHPDFQARYEAIAPGFGAFLPRAMKAWAGRQQPN